MIGYIYYTAIGKCFEFLANVKHDPVMMFKARQYYAKAARSYWGIL